MFHVKRCERNSIYINGSAGEKLHRFRKIIRLPFYRFSDRRPLAPTPFPEHQTLPLERSTSKVMKCGCRRAIVAGVYVPIATYIDRENNSPAYCAQLHGITLSILIPVRQAFAEARINSKAFRPVRATLPLLAGRSLVTVNRGTILRSEKSRDGFSEMRNGERLSREPLAARPLLSTAPRSNSAAQSGSAC
jgi:hypothetical protein